MSDHNRILKLSQCGGILQLSKIEHHGGYCFVVKLSGLPEGDGIGINRSNVRLFEGDRELGPGHISHDEIGKLGAGRFSHWGDNLYFASSDGSDPRNNGRVYQLVYSTPHAWRLAEQDGGGIVPLTNICHVSGKCFVAPLPALPDGDEADSSRSNVRLFEDGKELTPGHVEHDQIANHGGGRYSHWGQNVYFSTSDGSDPRTNGCEYQVCFYGKNGNARRSLALTAASLDYSHLDEEWRFIWGEKLFEAFVPQTHMGERSRLHFGDAGFRADYEKFNPENHRGYDAKYTLKELLKLALAVDGHIAECGVYRGASAYLLAKASSNSPNGVSKTLHLFDSYRGLSEPNREVDGTHWSGGDLSCSRDAVAANLADFGDRIELYEGWIPQCFGKVREQRYCFVHVDVDLYAPTRDALNFFGARVNPGGLIVCDDYGFSTCPGARRAMDEFSRDVGCPVVELSTGQGLIILS